MNKLRHTPILFIISLFAMSSCLKNDISTLPEPVKRPINLSNPVEVYNELSDLNDLPESEEDYDTVFIDTSLVIFDYQGETRKNRAYGVKLKYSLSTKYIAILIDELSYLIWKVNNPKFHKSVRQL